MNKSIIRLSLIMGALLLWKLQFAGSAEKARSERSCENFRFITIATTTNRFWGLAQKRF